MAGSQLSGEDLQRLARVGAATRLEQIESERANILRAFPDLAGGRGPAVRGTTKTGPSAAAPARRAPRRHVRRGAPRRLRPHDEVLGGTAQAEEGHHQIAISPKCGGGSPHGAWS